ncbi:sensor histidine kinase [Domibacillus sp. DTU_2020_1001157_1_SI_ALB_TIR_016]|uniref:sensor histidine kinase n=1 Tax=Domibacillus sp. DTU_2020_1001157_1_SI_ALB_TIR_016 TaxID=3077789 RepID=UPI0028F16CB8|nr:sensor histidine kinase [Domibacillus sp. DTU_2020_1001157_1_SI_ALB_TIR_016]WNS79005.1 sensor histidine kinase [Domibacillus sp. DTU_2020_1001157_1_SI_ALB_TIR_016]
MRKQLKKWNTLRNQILFIFLLVMIIVLLIVSLLTLSQVSSLLKNNAEKQIQQVAIEANGRIESLYEQINMNSKLVITDEEVQRVLTNVYEGKQVTFNDRQKLMGHINRIMGNTDGIFSFQLFSGKHQRVLPLDEDELKNRIGNRWIEEANRARGRMVWIGEDPHDKNYFLAIRRVNLIERQYSNGGYLLISINRDHFNFANEEYGNDQYSILLDQYEKPIIQNFTGDITSIIENDESIIQLNQRDYMVTKQPSGLTGWTVLILTPVSELTEGLSGIRTGIIFSGVVGVFIFTISSFFLSTIITRPIVRLTKTMQRAGEGSLTLNPDSSSVNEIVELNSTYNQLVKETNHLIQMVYQKEILRSQSELKALQAQINPHFLFNTLDALHWSLEEKDEEELAELVVAMSDLFRYTITKETDDDWVFLKDEIKHIGDYMEIMKMRFDERLQWHVSVPAEYEFVRIPKLIIQPLVENATLHGAGKKAGKCQISVTVEPVKQEDKERIRISVQDDGSGMDKERLEWIIQAMKTGGTSSATGKGMAISNVYKRLQLYYKGILHSDLLIESKVNEGTKISFELPIDGGE